MAELEIVNSRVKSEQQTMQVCGFFDVFFILFFDKMIIITPKPIGIRRKRQKYERRDPSSTNKRKATPERKYFFSSF